MARLYANENFPLAAVEELRRLGHDVLTTQDAGQANRSVPDAEVLQFAVSQQRVLVTYNRTDFIDLHYQDAVHEGIIVCTVDADVRALAQRIHQQIAQGAPMHGKLLRVNRPG
ncbi:hypothetical protein CMK11_09610 [Candidatus Poribacteria bacterium]|nr:hypothetical protein [Candidatus Poribacteria bacterium]